MPSLYDAQTMIAKALDEAAYKVGTGECYDQNSVERTAMLYCQRIGEVTGLKQALDIIGRLQKGEE